MGTLVSFKSTPPSPDDVLRYFFSQINTRYPNLQLDLQHPFVRKHYIPLNSLALAYLHTAPQSQSRKDNSANTSGSTNSEPLETASRSPDIRALFFAETILQMLSQEGLVTVKS